MTLQIFLHFFHHKFVTSLQSTSLPPAHSASQMRYSLETPFVRSAAEDAWGHSRPTPSALRRCATPPPARPRSADLIASRSSGGVRPRQRSRLQLTPDSVGGTRTDADAPRSAAADTLQHTPAHLFENSVHLSHSFRIESGSRLITASLHHRRHPHSSSRSDGTLP